MKKGFQLKDGYVRLSTVALKITPPYMAADAVGEVFPVFLGVGSLVCDDLLVVDGHGHCGGVLSVGEGGARKLPQFHRADDYKDVP